MSNLFFMLFPYLIVSFLSISCIFLSSSLLFAARARREALKVKQLNYVGANFGPLWINYNSFFTDVDFISRACSARFLTSDVRLVNLQNNIYFILKILSGDDCLARQFSKSYKVYHDTLSSAQSKLDINVMETLDEKFIEYIETLKCLVVTKVISGDCGIRTVKRYTISVQLPPVNILYGRMMAKGIDLHFVLRMFPHMINLYKANFRIQIPEASNLTKDLNDLVKEFIWKYCLEKNENIDQYSLLIMKYLAKYFFRESLGAQLYTLKQGRNGFLFTHLIGKPCSIYESKFFPSIGYLKHCIEFLEQYKLPICPSAIEERFSDHLFYCVYIYNPDEDNKMKFSGSKQCKQKETTSLLKTAMPLMRIPEDTLLSTYIIIPKKNLISLLNEKKQKHGSNKMRDINTHQDIKSIPSDSCPMISDEQLRIFMKRFTKYLYTDANWDLFDEAKIVETLERLTSELKELSRKKKSGNGF